MSLNKSQLRLLFEIFISFSKIGPVTFGGGFAMIPQIEREMVDSRKWMKTNDIADVIAIAGSAPGALGINAALCIGYRLSGFKGAVAAFLGVFLPTFLIVLMFSVTYIHFRDNPKVAAAFEGMAPAIVALIAYAGYKIGKVSIIDKTTLVTAFLTVLVLLLLRIHPIWIMLIAPFVGIALITIKKKLGMAIITEKQPKKQKQKFKYPDYYIGDGI